MCFFIQLKLHSYPSDISVCSRHQKYVKFGDDDDDDDDDEERRVALFPAVTVLRDPHHRQICDTSRAGFEPMQNLCSGLVE